MGWALEARIIVENNYIILYVIRKKKRSLFQKDVSFLFISIIYINAHSKHLIQLK